MGDMRDTAIEFAVMFEEPNSGSKVLSEVPEAYNALEVLLQYDN